MRQRPVACVAFLLFLVLLLMPAEFFYRTPRLTEKCKAEVLGYVERRTWKNEKMQLLLEDCQIRTGEDEFQEDRLLIYTKDPTEYEVGSILSLSGTIYPIEEPTNPGQFNSRLYYAGKGISYTLYADHVNHMGGTVHPVKEQLLRLQKQIGQIYETVLEEPEDGILKAMVLGDKTELDSEVQKLYQQNGISHVLAISGLHISLIGMGLYKMLKRITGYGMISAIPTMALLMAYGWMTGGSLSSVRAVGMCAIAILADLVGRTYDMLTAMGVMLLVIARTNPLAVKQSAFLLSFGAVLGIAWFGPLWTLEEKKKKKRKWREGLQTSLSVLLMTFPVLLQFFSEYALYSTFLNLLVIPLMSVLMAAGILCGAVGLLNLQAARLPGLVCHGILSVYQRMGNLCLRLPGSVLTIGIPDPWKVLIYYLTLALALFLLYKEKQRKKYWRKQESFRISRRILCWCRGSVLFTLLLLCVHYQSGMEICMLDVGQGDCLFWELPDGTTFLSDGGSTSVSDVGNYRIVPFLKARGVHKIDYLLISHMDQDHINGIKEVLEDGSIQVEQALLPGLQRKDDAYLEMEALLENANVEKLCLNSGDLAAQGDYSMRCLWPPVEGQTDDRNKMSLVMEVEYGEFRMLLTGDIDEQAERQLAATGQLETVDILKVAHHGSRYSSSSEFLAQATPAVSLISCSATNRYGHPGQETLERLQTEKSAVRITKNCGAICLWTDGSVIKLKTVK